MRHLVVLGAGTAGTMLVNALTRRLDGGQWRITVVDRDDVHLYQPGLLFVPFGRYTTSQIERPERGLLPRGVELRIAEVDRVEPEANRVLLDDGSVLDYDYLVIATGVEPRPGETPGLLDGPWRETIHDFYTADGATALAGALQRWQGGRLVVNVVDMPVKCPVAPLEFAFLADAFLADRGLREKTELVYVTPLSGAFTKPIASQLLAGELDKRGIELEPDFLVERVEDGRLVSYDEREVPFDLLVTTPVNMGADYVARSGLGNEVNCVPVDPHTLQAKGHDAIFAVGDANDAPTSKAGSVAHFSVEVFVENFLDHVAGRPMRARFDGHANCFIESGRGKGLLIDFNYDTEPLPGRYPYPVVGPLRLLEETRANHLGKLAFQWVYWHLLLPGRRLPVSTAMSMAGKKRPEPATASASRR